MNPKTYRDILRTVLIERQKVNPAYSLRAFAQSIGLSNSQLSRVLNSKQGLSLEKAKNIAAQVGFSEEETDIFCLMVQATDARSKKERDEAHTKLEDIQIQKMTSKDLGLQDYEILRDWYNIAILELMDTHSFSGKPEWIAKQIGITPLLAEESIKKLLDIGVIESISGEIKKTQKILKINKSTPSDLMKNYYEQLLIKAKESIFLQSIDDRHLSSVTISLDEQDIKTLNKEIDKFRSHFNSLAESLANKKGKKRKNVYCLTTQFFKINTGANL